MKVRIKSVPQQLNRNARKWKHGDGGNLFGGEKDHSSQMVTTGGAGYTPPAPSSDFLHNTILNLSSNIMTGIHNWGDDGYTSTSSNRPEEQNGGIAQRTFLAGRKIQEEEFKKHGFIKDTSGNYGLVKKAVGNNKYPIWQRTPDEISRDKLIAIGNTYDGFTGIPKNKAIIHGGSYPTAYYVDPSTVGFDFKSGKEKTPKFYAKSWDLNDYDGKGGSTAGIFGKALDFIGSPVVQTTGYIDITDSRLKKVDNMLEDYLYEKGLVKHRLDASNPYGAYFYGLPEITVTGKKRKKALGGNLYDGTSQPTQKVNMGLSTTNRWRPYTLGEIVSNGERVARQREALEEAMRNFQIESNDATSVASGRPQNRHLEEKAVRGAKANAAWEKEHPNLTAWSYLPSAAVIGTALAPLGAAGWTGLSALGDAAAATSVGQGITNFLAPIATTSYAGATVPQWFDLGLTSGFGAHGVQTAIDERGVSPMTALEVAPLGRLVKPYKNMLQNKWEEGKLENILGAIEDINPNTKKAATQKLMDFINSEDYHNRLKAAGLDKYWDEIGSLIESRINAENLFPGKFATNLIQERGALGSSHPTKGIFVQAGIPEEDLLSIIDHELAHYSTMGLGKNDIINIIYSKILGMPSNKVISKMMKYNDKLASTKNYNDFRKAFFEIQGINTPSIKDNISALRKYMYYNSSQEKRARAYATLQEALKKGQSTDEFVDSYTYDNKIIGSAPDDLTGLGLIMKPEEIKKYLKGFLSVSSPAAVSTLLDNEEK